MVWTGKASAVTLVAPSSSSSSSTKTIQPNSLVQNALVKLQAATQESKIAKEESVQVQRLKAQQRLMKDLKEIQENPLPTVSALPLEKDFFEWHANLLGSSETIFGGLVFHLKIIFPHSYPNQPPKVQLMNFIDHPNVYGGWRTAGEWNICLDMVYDSFIFCLSLSSNLVY